MDLREVVRVVYMRFGSHYATLTNTFDTTDVGKMIDKYKELDIQDRILILSAIFSMKELLDLLNQVNVDFSLRDPQIEDMVEDLCGRFNNAKLGD